MGVGLRKFFRKYKRNTTSSTLDDSQVSKDYVESLHQNNKSTLLYGKNNVFMILKQAKQPLAGYLSLHQYGESLILKWTPNQLMSGVPDSTAAEKSIYWEHAMNITLQEIVYLHCHQDARSDWIVLVGQDGVQRPPVHFPRGGHLLAFLSCLENGLLPHGQLDPPLWSTAREGDEGLAGKKFPKLRRKASKTQQHQQCQGTDEIDGVNGDNSLKSDFVFRIVYNSSTSVDQIEEMLDNPLEKTELPAAVITEMSAPSTPRSTPIHSISTTSSTSSSKSIDQNGTAGEHGEPIQIVCQTMKKQIISRAFYGWLSHCRHLRTVRTHLVGLVRDVIVKTDEESEVCMGLTENKWEEFQAHGNVEMAEIYKLVYFGGMAHSLRRSLWPILLRGSLETVDMDQSRREYGERMGEWLIVEAVVRQRDRETMATNLAKLSSEGSSSAGGCETEPLPSTAKGLPTYGSNEVFEENSVNSVSSPKGKHQQSKSDGELKTALRNSSEVGIRNSTKNISDGVRNGILEGIAEDNLSSGSSEGSPVRGLSDVYSQELLEAFGLNIHRIDKDVKRCDRNYWYFMERNLEKLRNVMCTYVWEHLEIGYVQGMCDLAAPLLVILDDEAEAYMCFKLLMARMSSNFPTGGGAMDTHFGNMRSLLQVLDHDLFSLIRQNGDYTHFYFCYRWFLLDFKREFTYQDVFLVWETIWAARHVASMDFVLFLALALLNYYRDIILSNSMDFTDIIKFFNEMAERHDAKVILQIARNLVLDLQTLIEDK